MFLPPLPRVENESPGFTKIQPVSPDQASMDTAGHPAMCLSGQYNSCLICPVQGLRGPGILRQAALLISVWHTALLFTPALLFRSTHKDRELQALTSDPHSFLQVWLNIQSYFYFCSFHFSATFLVLLPTASKKKSHSSFLWAPRFHGS